MGGAVTLSTFAGDDFSEPPSTGDTYSSSIDVLTQIMHGELFAARQRKNQALAEERQDDEILSRITRFELAFSKSFRSFCKGALLRHTIE